MRASCSDTHHRGAASFEAMATLPKTLRQQLAAGFSVARPEIAAEQRSSDGTRKWLLRFADGQEVETVFIPEDDRGALCVSTQVGCTLTCSFCHTGTMPLVRNLGAAGDRGPDAGRARSLEEWPTGREGRLFTNIVMMGMGEPLFNYDATVAGLRLAMDEHGLSLVTAANRLDLGGRPTDRAIGCRSRRRAGDLAACGTRRAAQRVGADQSQMEHRHAARRLPQLSLRGARSPSSM